MMMMMMMSSCCVQQCDGWRRLIRPRYSERREGWTASTVSPTPPYTRCSYRCNTHACLLEKQSCVYAEDDTISSGQRVEDGLYVRGIISTALLIVTPQHLTPAQRCLSWRLELRQTLD